MNLPWLPDGHHLRALQLIDAAPRPFVPPPPQPCGVKWCVAMADAKTGTPIDGPRLVNRDARHSPTSYAPRCTVHRDRESFRPKTRRYNLARLFTQKPARKKAAA
jgi:hypothetical protein